MLKSTRAALAVGLGLVGAAGFVAQTHGQDGAVRQTNGTAQSVPKPAVPTVIGTLDMDSVLKNYDKFRSKMETTQTEVQVRHNELLKIANEAQAESEKLQKLSPGSLDEKKYQDKITNLKAQFNAGKESAQMEFSKKETEILAEMYNEIQKMSAAVAKQRGITLVVKYSAAPASAADPKSLEAALFRSVVYADPRLDLTPDVTKWLNHYYKQSGGPAPKGSAAGAGTATTAPAAAPATAAGNAPTLR